MFDDFDGGDASNGRAKVEGGTQIMSIAGIQWKIENSGHGYFLFFLFMSAVKYWYGLAGNSKLFLIRISYAIH